MVRRKVIGGRQVFVEDRSKIVDAARNLARNPHDPSGVTRLSQATKEATRSAGKKTKTKK